MNPLKIAALITLLAAAVAACATRTVEPPDAGASADANPAAPGDEPGGPLSPPPDVAAPPADAIKTVVKHGGAEVTLSSKILRAGAGEVMPADTDVVTFHYTGWTADGELLDSSTSLGSPVVLTIGDMLPGWREALKLMRVGEQRRVWIPEALTWAHLPGAPQGTLVYEFELFEIGAPPPPDDEEIPGRL